jgi:hypothetical protein
MQNRNTYANAAGNIAPINNPAFIGRSNPAAIPTVAGPKEQPMLPANTKAANMEAPPIRNLPDARLSVPGHKMPTDKPINPQPKKDIAGNGEKAASK